MLLKFFRETKAYTSIFLCLVLLPMVTYSAMIIDASRLQSARVQAQSAGDLAINAAMSEYEQVLEDMYGLFANATSKEQMEPVIRQYFEETISGKLVNPDKGDVGKFAQALTDYAMSGGKTSDPTKEYTNFLQMKLPEDTDEKQAFLFEPVPTSAISNPAVMKGQIIDYMKYKGPISVGQNFLNKLGFLKDMKNQSSAVQGKIELAKKVAAVNDTTTDNKYKETGNPMQVSFEKINKYNDLTEEYNNIRNNPFDKKMLQDELDNMSRINILEVSIQKLKNTIRQEDDVKKEIESEIDIDGLTDNIYQDTETSLKLSGEWQNWYHVSYNYTKEEETVTETVNREDEEENNEEDSDDEESEKTKETETKTFKVITVNLDNTEAQADQVLKDNIKDLNDKSDKIKKAQDAFSTNNEKDKYEVGKYTNYFDAQKTGIESLNNNIHNLETQKFYQGKFNEYLNEYCNGYATLEKYFNAYEYEFKSQYSGIEIRYTSSVVDGLTCRTVELKYPDNIAVNIDEYIENFKKYVILSKFKECLDSTIEEYKDEYGNLKDGVEETTNYEKAEKYHFEQAIAESGFKKYCDVVTNIVENLDKANIWLSTIKDKADAAKKEADSQVSSINSGENKVEDDATRSQLTSDIETLSKSVNPADVEKLNNIINGENGYLPRFQEVLKKLEEIKYFDVKNYDYIGSINEESKKITDATKFSDFKGAINFTEKVNNVEELTTKDADSLWNELLLNDRHKGYEFLDNDNFLKENIKPEAKPITGTTAEEVFYNVLKNTIEAEDPKNKPEQSAAQKQHLDEIKALSDVKGGDDAGQPSDKADNKYNELKEDDEPPKAEETKKEDDYHAGSDTEFKEEAERIGNTQEPYYCKQAGNVDVPDSSNAKNKANDGKNQLAQANDLLDLIAKLGNGLKDDIYLEEYFTEMFTCQTDKLNTDKFKKELTLLNGYSTNPINPKYINMKNAWYGKEMEYILWGQSDLKQNITRTETTIFLLRFAVNSVYAFTASDIQSMASSMATALVGWSVILVPVVQVCITLAVALAESALDLSMLKDGKDVPLIKDSATFICSPRGMLNEAIDYGIKKGTQFASDKVSEGIDTLADKAKEGTAALKDQAEQITKYYIEQQKQSITTSISDNFTAPIVQSVKISLSKLNLDADTFNQETAEEQISLVIEDTWTSIGNNISKDNLYLKDDELKEDEKHFSFDGLVRKLYDSITKEDRDNLAKEIAKKVSPETSIAGEIENYINIKIIGGKDKDGNDVKGWISKISGDIESTVQTTANKLEKNLNDAIDNGADNLKEKANEAIEEAGNQISGKAGEFVAEHIKNSDAVGTKSKSIAAKVTMNYKEYCKLFMFIGLVGNQDDAMLQRAAVLMEMNVKYAVEGHKDTGTVTNRTPSSGENFDITKAYTMFYVQADMEMGTLFPWAVKVETNGTDAEASLDLSHLGENSVNLRYSGMAGY